MKRRLMLAAAVMLCAGLIISAAAAAAMKFDLSLLNTSTVSCPAGSAVPRRSSSDLTLLSRTVQEDFDSVSVTSDVCSVELLPSDNGTAFVEYPAADGIGHSVTVENGVLNITWQDNRSPAARIGIYFGDEDIFRIRIYLPAAQLDALTVKTQSGDIDIGRGWSLGRVSLTSASGDMEVSGISCSDAELESASGDISLEASELSSHLRVRSTSGDIKLQSVVCENLEIDSTSGDAQLRGVLASGEMRIETSSGDISLERCDGAQLELTASSGEVSGSLLSGKIFSAASVSGDIELPASLPSGGVCRIETASGDISVAVVP